MKTLIIGANGMIGKILCDQCHQQNISIRVMLRSEKQTQYFEDQGIKTVVTNLESDFSHAFDGCQRVVFTAGSGAHTGGDKTILVDLYGAMRTIDESQKRGIKHYIMISALRAENPLETPENIKHYFVAKKISDDYLMKSNVNHTILRPGRLTHNSGSGCLQKNGQASPSPITVSRENVASCIVACFDNEKVYGKVINLLDGETPIQNILSL